MSAGAPPTPRIIEDRAASPRTSRAFVADAYPDPDDAPFTPTVLHVLEAIAGGTSRHLIDLVGHTHGVRHVVAAPRRRVGAVADDYAIRDLEEAGAEVHLVEMRRSPLHPLNLFALWRLMRIASKLRPDVIHGHSAIGGALARVVPARHRAIRFYTPNGLNQSRFAMWIERMLVGRTTRVVAVSASEASLLDSLGLAGKDSLVVIPNAIVDPTTIERPHVDLRELAGFPPDALLVGSLARLLPQKAPQRFVECCRQVAQQNAEAYFLLIGDGPEAADVDALADCEELRGRFVRIPELQRAAPLLQQLDIFVLLSRFEGGPYAPMEAMFGETPVVLSDGVGNVDVLSGELARLIVPSGDPEGAARRVAYLLANHETRRQVGNACREYALANFDAREMGRQYTRTYIESLLNEVIEQGNERLRADRAALHLDDPVPVQRLSEPSKTVSEATSSD